MATIKTAFSTLSCPDWSWNDLLTHGPGHGYDGVEIRLLERETDLLKVPEFQPGQRTNRRRELNEAGFAVCGLASSVRFDYPEKPKRDEQLAIGREYVNLAVELGGSFVRVFGDVVPARPSSPTSDGTGDERRAVIRQIAEGLDELGEFAAGAGIQILMETHGDFCDSRLVQETFEEVTNPAVGVLWDTHHPWRFYGESVAETMQRIGRWVRHTHWKDSVSDAHRQLDEDAQAAAREAHQLMSGHLHADYVLFGEGEFPAAECLRLLHEAGYGGWYCLEWEKMWHPEIEDPEIALPPFPEKIRELWREAVS